MVGVNAIDLKFRVYLIALGVTGLVLVNESYAAELTPYVVSGANSRVEFEEAHADDEERADSKAEKEIDLQWGFSLIMGANFGNVNLVDSVTYSETGAVIIDDSDAEDFAGMFYLHRRDYRGCSNRINCLGWGPYLGLVTKPSGGLGGGWSLGIMGGFRNLPGSVGFGYVVRKDLRYLVTNTGTGLPDTAVKDFDGFAVTLGFSF